MKVLNRILVANRGEIAVRVIRAIKDLGMESVAVYSDADAESLHVTLADYAIRLPGSLSSDTYLNIPAICKAVEESKSDAVHPGFGFLSENPEFVKAIEGVGAKFIGPSAESMDLMGNKVSAKKLMEENGVPTVPGSKGRIESFTQLKDLAESAGLPLILKASAGGGGRGMRVVRALEDLEKSYEACKREAQEYFGNDEVFAEKYIDRPRHIEFQVLCDSKGQGVHLFERDCSIQRRHQKLFEEAPSTYLNDEQRNRIGDLALQAAKAAGYEGAGTVEFICESPEDVYFMEMNTRIQVEHPVTEEITGIDLIAAQIQIAQGQPLPFQQEAIANVPE